MNLSTFVNLSIYPQHPQFNFPSFILTPSHITYHIRVLKIPFKSQFTLFISISPLNVKTKYFFIDSTNFLNYILSNIILATLTCIFPHFDTINIRHQAKYVKLNILSLWCIIGWKHGLKGTKSSLIPFIPISFNSHTYSHKKTT
jgi:hypothetical protein